MAAAKPLYVTAPLVVAKTTDNKMVNLRQGDVVTDGIAKESIDHLRDLGFVSEKSPFDATAPDDN